MNEAAVRNTFLETALAYARRRWRVLPCEPRDKRPHARLTPNGFKDATADEATIRRWWSEEPMANVGVVCGPESFAVLDLDKHGNTDGFATAQELYGLEITGPAARTGGGGLHLLYRYPEQEVRNHTVAEGVEVRINGYIVVPPSVHPSGRRYEWLEEPTGEPLPPLPAWALDGHSMKLERTAEAADGAIPEGERNTVLTSLAGTMRRKGISAESIQAALMTENARRCKPPLSEDEVRRIAASVARYEPASEAEDAMRDSTDAGNARLLCALYGDRLRFDHRRRRWLVWRGHWWAEDTDGEVLRLALEAAQMRLNLAFERLKGDEAKAAARWAITSRSRHRLEAALWVARNLPPISDAGEGWDEDPWLLAAANGVVCLRTGELHNGRPEDRLSVHAEVPFDPTAKCSRWQEFLGEVFGGETALVSYIQRAVGYSLTGSLNEQLFFVCWGRGANGKSVFLETLRHVLGPYAYAAGFAAFERDGRGEHPEALAELAGRRLVTASETRESTRLNESRLKALSHGDSMSARFMYGARFEFRPTCKIWLALNHKPRVSDDSLGFWRSVHLVPFNRQFLGDDADPALLEKLRGEAPGILAWAVQGCRQWQEEGLRPPDAVSGATDEYRRESDPLAAFIDERCVLGPQCVTPTGELYRAYQDWAERQGMPIRERLSHRAFGLRMRERLEQKHVGPKAARTRAYVGIGLVAQEGG